MGGSPSFDPESLIVGHQFERAIPRLARFQAGTVDDLTEDSEYWHKAPQGFVTSVRNLILQLGAKGVSPFASGDIGVYGCLTSQ
jgi:hypothetical protein